jgi:ubiquitin-like domain-containing CTD phosphatase 1
MDECKINLKWNKQDLTFDLQSTQTLSELKSLIYEQTRILPDRQKLMGLKLKIAGVITNTTTMDELNLTSKIMLMGTPEESITELNSSQSVQPDLSEGQEEEQQDTTWIDDPDTVPLDKREEVRIKLERRVKTYQGKILNEPRPGKKLLVLDIDYTLFDHRSAAETGAELMRPYLHEFLTTVYEHYDIGIWSATSMKWIESKMKLLGIEGISQGRTTNTTFDYKVIFYM